MAKYGLLKMVEPTLKIPGARKLCFDDAQLDRGEGRDPKTAFRRDCDWNGRSVLVWKGLIIQTGGRARAAWWDSSIVDDGD